MPHLVFGTAGELERGLLEFRRTMNDFSGVNGGGTGWQSTLSGGSPPCGEGNVSNWQYFNCTEMSLVMISVQGLQGKKAPELEFP